LSPKSILEQHPKGKAFAHLLNGYVRYPVLVDDSGTVLSMPPIINSEKTRVGRATKDLFIDVTGFSRDTVNKVLAIVVTSLKESMPRCMVHTVTVKYPADTSVTPDMTTETFTLNYERCTNLVGCDMSGSEIVACLKRMRFEAQDAGDHCVVQVPCYRTDIRHEQDLIEDVAIAYGYHNLKPRKLEAFTTGAILPAEHTKQQIREMLVSMGFLEIVTIMLTSEQREFTTLGLPVPQERVIIDNPISTDQTMVRTGLIAGLLEIIAANTSNELPQKLFEVGETVRVNPADATVIEEVKLAAGIVHSKAGFSDIKSTLKNTMHEFGLDWALAPAAYPFHIPGRSASVIVNNVPVGHIGELHPLVLDTCKIPNPVVLLELNISKLGCIGKP
jgi:phenylalanyl-tRNA synthetase beta chain